MGFILFARVPYRVTVAMRIEKSTESYQLLTGDLAGKFAASSRKLLSELEGVFSDADAFSKMDGSTVVYEVSSHMPVAEGTPGGLFFGTSRIHPGKVGKEYFMTKGHFHARRETAEYYWGISGTGLLLLMDENGGCAAQKVEPDSLHYIGGHIAHRLVNTGDQDLVVGACWPSDAGHDYGSIQQSGFPVRVVCENGEIRLEQV